jgi:hypothetical protein
MSFIYSGAGFGTLIYILILFHPLPLLLEEVRFVIMCILSSQC